jgi:putative FmdB family regulatory protein
MPIYEYRCEKCGHQEEFLQKASEPPLEQCPACRKQAFKKLLSAAGFQLKGSGWYATDFKSGAGKKADKASDKGDKPEAKSDSKPDAKPESKSETKTESKPAAAAAAD